MNTLGSQVVSISENRNSILGKVGEKVLRVRAKINCTVSLLFSIVDKTGYWQTCCQRTPYLITGTYNTTVHSTLFKAILLADIKLASPHCSW